MTSRVPPQTVAHTRGGPHDIFTDEDLVFQIEARGHDGETLSDPEILSVVDTRTGSDVQATLMPAGSPAISGQNIVLPMIQDYEAGVYYEVKFRYTVAGNKFVGFTTFRVAK